MENGQVSPIEIIQLQEELVKIIRLVIKMQMLLQFKLENILAVLDDDITVFVNIVTASGSFAGEIFTDEDRAYYYIKNINNSHEEVNNN